jgi:hypothetical protein
LGDALGNRNAGADGGDKQMNSLGHAAVAASLAAGIAAPAFAAPMRFDCDCMSGAYSEVAQTQTGPHYLLRADVTPKRVGQDRQWRPNGLLHIRSADGKAYIAVRMTATISRPQAFSIYLETEKDGEKKQFSVTTVKLGETVHASIEVKDGAARVEVAGQVADFSIPLGKGAEVSAGCSTGQFMFEKLEIAESN